MRLQSFRFAPDRFAQESWRGQLARVERWYQRATKALYDADPDAADFLYAFFQNAYHLQDWLRNSGAASRADLKVVTDSPALKLCRDVCNGSKHFALDERQMSDHIGLMREYVVRGLSDGRVAGSRPRLLVFEPRGGGGDVVVCEIDELMRDCIVAWRDFCAKL
jgi:hypothetical protein